MSIEQKTINTIRVLSAEAVQKANSGHPGLPLGAAPMAYGLWANIMNHNPKNPNWINRDRFILSAGHGSALIYSLLHLFDYGLTIEDLKDFRQIGSKTPGHPEYGHTVGVEMTTGPLGQGISTAVGMAMAEAHLAAKFNREDLNIIDHYTYVLAGDGDMMEGINYEATSLAGSLGLGKLIVLYDSNHITIEGSTDLAFTEDVSKRFEAFGWEVLEVKDGNNLADICEKLEMAKKNLNQPTMIKITTEIGYGSPSKQGKNSAHGEPLGRDDLNQMKENFGFSSEEFFVAEEVTENMSKIVEELIQKYEDWEAKYKSYNDKFPDLSRELSKALNKQLPMDYLDSEEFWNFDKGISTREASGIVINRLAKEIPNLIGGSADLAPSNKTYMNDREDFSKDNYLGTNIRFGVREHAMAAIGNGMSLHGGVIPYVGTFFIFSDYMKPAMRLASLMNIPITHVLTHDSIGVGEDGPTHQPIEQLAMLRSMPNYIAFRPADARETAAAWYLSLTRESTPVGIALTRQNLPLLEGTGREALKGAYILKEEEGELETILIATGSEVHLAIEAAKLLEEKGIGTRVVSMPSFEIFEEQSQEYKKQVLPSNIKNRIAIEAGTSFGWERYVGLDGKIIAMEGFGASGPGDKLFEMYGFTVENIVNKAINK